MKNTGQQSQLDDAFGFAKDSVETADSSFAELEEILEKERSDRKIERFYLFFICIIFLDGDIFKDIGWGLLPIFLLEIVMLLGLAAWLGVDHIAVFLERLLNKYIPKPLPNKYGSDPES